MLTIRGFTIAKSEHDCNELVLTNGTFDVTIENNDLWTEYTKDDWLQLLTVDDKQLSFSDGYGSHIDNQTNTITRTGDLIVFAIDGVNGMRLTVYLETERCRQAIEQVATIVGNLHEELLGHSSDCECQQCESMGEITRQKERAAKRAAGRKRNADVAICCPPQCTPE